MAARAVIARTRYNASDYVAARDILDADFGKGDSVPGLLAGSLLWAAVMAALGHTPADIMKRAQVLQRAADRLAAARPDDAEAIQLATRERLDTMEAMVLALAGEYTAAPAAAGARRGGGRRQPGRRTPSKRRSGSASSRTAPGRRPGTERPRRDVPGNRGRRSRSR